MQDKEKNYYWGVNDYYRNLSADMIAQYLAKFRVNILTFKLLLNALQFTEQEENIIITFQSSRISKFLNMIISSQTKIMAAFRSFLETSYLRGSFPQKLEYSFGYPKSIPHRLISLLDLEMPQFKDSCLNVLKLCLNEGILDD